MSAKQLIQLTLLIMFPLIGYSEIDLLAFQNRCHSYLKSKVLCDCLANDATLMSLYDKAEQQQSERLKQQFYQQMLLIKQKCIAKFDKNEMTQYRNIQIIHSGLAQAASAKITVAEYYIQNNKLPNSNAEANYQPFAATKNVHSVTIGNQGHIYIKLKNMSGGDLIVLTPTVQEGRFRWHCNHNHTTVDKTLLPNC